METLQIMIMAAFQGVAEFLPISSSGHLPVLGQFFGFAPEENVRLNIVLHAGTLLAILVFYFKTLLQLVLDRSQWRIIGMVILGSVPAGVIGITLKKTGMETILFNNLLTVGCGFLITAVLLWWASRRQSTGNETPIGSMSWKQALIIGLAQAVAITPGISRSGSTIAAGMRCGLKTADCAKFSFLLAIPAIGGAALLDVIDMIKDSAAAQLDDLGILVGGFFISAVVGYFSLALLLKILEKGKLMVFSWYVGALGLVVLGIFVFHLTAK